MTTPGGGEGAEAAALKDSSFGCMLTGSGVNGEFKRLVLYL